MFANPFPRVLPVIYRYSSLICYRPAPGFLIALYFGCLVDGSFIRSLVCGCFCCLVVVTAFCFELFVCCFAVVSQSLSLSLSRSATIWQHKTNKQKHDIVNTHITKAQSNHKIINAHTHTNAEITKIHKTNTNQTQNRKHAHTHTHAHTQSKHKQKHNTSKNKLSRQHIIGECKEQSQNSIKRTQTKRTNAKQAQIKH